MWQMSSLSCLDGGKSSVVSPAFKSHADDFLKQKFQWKAFFSSSYLECATYLNKQQVIYWTLDGIGVIVLQMFTRQPPFFFAFPYIFQGTAGTNNHTVSPPNSQSLCKKSIYARGKDLAHGFHVGHRCSGIWKSIFFFICRTVRVQPTQILGQI